MQDDPQPAFYWNKISAHTPHHKFHFSNIAKRVLDCTNAGGNSILSEAMSAELLYRFYKASDIRTEMEMEYIFSNWKIADFCVKIYGKNIGISVTRAMGYPDQSKFTKTSALNLLSKKINGLVLARNNSSERNSFYTSILSIWCQSNRIKNLLYKAWKTLPSDLRDNVIIICTVTENANFIFRDRD